LPRVSPIVRGTALAVYPDDETVTMMKTEGWATVKVGFVRTTEGDYEELVLKKADDGKGIAVRYYPHQRVKVSFSVKRHGTAVVKTGACTMRRVGDALVFHILDCVGIAKD
jgi:hypothetical protein